MPDLTPEESLRYTRHLSLPEFGPAGQEKLKGGSVLCIGAGGLGSPAISYLAAAGVGRLGIVDADVVDATNLQRQLLFMTADVGRRKAEAARDRVAQINPNVQVDLLTERFTAVNALTLAQHYDVILDGSDNFPTRYLSSDVAVWLKKPNVYASVMKFEGQASVFAPHLGGPCYRCMFPEPPPPGTVPSCEEAGVLGILPGLAGLLQATEVIKLLTGLGEPLIGRLLHVDTLRMKFREFKMRRDPQCAVCGENPTVTAPIDYVAFCGGLPACQVRPPEGEATVEDLAAALNSPPPDFLLLDVREAFERAVAQIPSALHIPLGQLESRLHELDATADIWIHCKAGGRSAKAVALLRSRGFSRVRNVAGGITAWTQRIDPSVPLY